MNKAGQYDSSHEMGCDEFPQNAAFSYITYEYEYMYMNMYTTVTGQAVLMNSRYFALDLSGVSQCFVNLLKLFAAAASGLLSAS